MFVGIGLSGSKGGDKPFSPALVGGLQLWLDAEVGVLDASGNPVTTDGQQVATWQDQSGRGAHAVQANAARRPVLRTGVNGKNNKPVVSFDATNITGLTTSNIAITQLSVFVVFTSEAPTGNAIIYYAENGNEGAWMQRTVDDPTQGPQYTTNHRLASIFRNNFRLYTPSSGINANPPDAGWNLFAQKSDGTSRKDGPIFEGHQLFSRGRWIFIKQDIQGNTGGQLINAPVSVGSTPAGGSALTGKIAELIIYNRDLEQTEHEAMENYLSQKWAVSLRR